MKKWTIQKNITSISIRQASKSRTRNDSCVCTLSRSGRLVDEIDDNANIIAAAPEMLAMLEELNIAGGLGIERHKEILKIIAKAKGAT